MDEPDKKAMFNVVLRHDSKFTARSNMDYFKEENFDVRMNALIKKT